MIQIFDFLAALTGMIFTGAVCLVVLSVLSLVWFLVLAVLVAAGGGA